MNNIDYGACVLRDSDDFTTSQREAFKTIIDGIYLHSTNEFQRQSERKICFTPHFSSVQLSDNSEAIYSADDNSSRRPHKVFVINGKRGSGKTSLLLSIHNLFVNADKHFERKKENAPLRFDKFATEKLFLNERRATALTIPIIMPNEMEHTENTLECILSHMDTFLDNKKNELDHYTTAYPPGTNKRSFESDSYSRSIANEIEELRNTMRQDISSGWAFSHKIGLEVLSRDANNFREYIDMRAEQAKKSYNRITAWQRFVPKFLETFNSQTLLVFIDDTDMSYKITSDILQTIRLYLSHPRIITVISMNVDYILHSLEMQTMANIDLGNHVDVQGERYRQMVRREIKSAYDYFYKVAPPPLWSYLTVSRFDREAILKHYLQSKADKKGDFRTTDYFKSITKCIVTEFSKLCDQALSEGKTKTREERHETTYFFDISHFTTARQLRNWCNNYFIFFDYHYELIGKTVRDIKLFAKEFVNHVQESDFIPNTSPFLVLSKRPATAIIKSRYRFDVRDIEGSMKKGRLILKILEPTLTVTGEEKSRSITKADTEFLHLAYYLDVYFTKHLIDLTPHDWEFLIPEEIFRYSFFPEIPYRHLHNFVFLGVSKLFFDTYIPINCLHFSDLLKAIETIKDDLDIYSPGTSKTKNPLVPLNNLLHGMPADALTLDRTNSNLFKLNGILRSLIYSLRLAVSITNKTCQETKNPISLNRIINLFPTELAGQKLKPTELIANIQEFTEMIVTLLDSICTKDSSSCSAFSTCVSVNSFSHTRKNLYLLNAITFSIATTSAYLMNNHKILTKDIKSEKVPPSNTQGNNPNISASTSERRRGQMRVIKSTNESLSSGFIKISKKIKEIAELFKAMNPLQIDEISSSRTNGDNSITVCHINKKITNSITDQANKIESDWHSTNPEATPLAH